MKNLELTQMETVNACCSASQQQALAVAGTVATVAGFFGPIGSIIAAPTAIGVGIGSMYCAF